MDEDSLGRNTEYQNTDTVFSSFLRLGFVTDINSSKRLARVKFADLGYTSDWIPVLISGTSDYLYMPKVGAQVLCIYEPVRHGRGFVLGGIQPWR